MTIYKGKVERVRDGHVEGWATGAGTPPELILHIDDQPVNTAPADAPQADGRCAFRIAIPAAQCDGAIHKIAVKVKDAPGFLNVMPLIAVIAAGSAAPQPPVAPSHDLAHDLGPPRAERAPPPPAPPTPPPSSSPQTSPPLRRPGRGRPPAEMPAHMSGFLDGVNKTYVYGWIVDRATPGPVDLVMFIDGRQVLTGRADGFRQDVRDAGTSDGHSGFTFDIPRDHWDGSPHLIDIYLAAAPGQAIFSPVLAIIPPSPQSTPRPKPAPVPAPPPPPQPEPEPETAPAPGPLRLHIEQMDSTTVRGWLVHSERRDLIAEADIYIDGIRFSTVTADLQRDDVVAAGLTERGGGFQFTPFNPGSGQPVRLQFASPQTGEFLPADLDTLVFAEPPARPVDHAYPHLLAADGRGVTLVTLSDNRSGDLDAAIEQAGDDDILLVGRDIEVTAGWLHGLRIAAYSDPRAATASALSSAPGPFHVPSGDDADHARRLRQAAAGAYPQVPLGNPYCLYIRRDTLSAIGPLGEVEDFCLRALRAGRVHILDDRTWVRHHEPQSDSKSDPTPEAVMAESAPLDRQFRDSPAVQGVHWRIRKALADPAVVKPRVLYVISTRIGGMPLTNRDLMTAISPTCEPWLLVCDSRSVELFRVDQGREVLVDRIALPAPIHPVMHRSPAYDDAVARLLLRHAIDLVHIRHLGWHGADLPLVCRRLGIPVILSLHDYYTVCPTNKLLDQDGVYCAGACTTTPGDCSVELWRQNEFPPLKNAFVHRWREIFAKAFEACDAFVTTSDAARDLFLGIYPQLRAKPFPVIPHGRDFARLGQLARPPMPGQPLKILVPGSLSPAKGADLINAIIALDHDRDIEWHLLGDSGKVTRAPNVVVHGEYERDDFAARVADIAPHIGAVLSIWAETWCHTLTEMWACGVPVAGIDCGAVGERIADHGGGWLFPLGITPREALTGLLALRDGEAWEGRVAEIAAWQTGYNRDHSLDAMAAAYEALYRERLNAQA